MKKLLFLVFSWAVLLGGFHKADAQDLFELKFTDSYGVNYKGLLVKFNDTKMYMRVAYFAEDMYKVVQVDYTTEHTTYQGDQYIVLFGSNPRFVTNPGQYGYNPDHLIFTNQSNLPFITDNPNDPNRVFLADQFRALSDNDISDDYLKGFYSNQEPDYLALKRMVGLERYTPPSSTVDINKNRNEKTYRDSRSDQPATLHLIVAANTAISDIGAGCAADERNLVGEFQGITSSLGISFKKYLVNGSNFTKQNLNQTLQRFSPGPNDIVIFVYRGHGFRWSDQREMWPQLDFRANNYIRMSNETAIRLDEVHDMITSKGARLNIVFGDCCNNDIGLTQNTNNNFLAMQGNNHYDPQRLKSLFMDTEGNILSCAASPGEYSWVNIANGGFYTVSFLQALREEISYLKNDKPDWQDVFDTTIKSARRMTDSCSNCTPQNGKVKFSAN